MRKLLGPHLAGQWADKLDLLRRWQPPLVLVLQPEVEKVRQLRAAHPDAVIIGRIYHDDAHYDAHIGMRPADFAYEIHQEIVNNPATPLLDYVQTNNEVCQDWLGIQNLNTFTERWMALADESRAYKCAILAFSVGNPDMPYKPGDPAGFDGRMLYWQQVLPSLNYAQRNGHILLLHAYGYPNMFAPDADWYIYRYERQVQANLRTLGITNLKYAYGEIGIDRLLVGEKGGYKSVPTTDQGYVNQLLQWERDQQGQSLLLGGAIFTFGDSGGWGSYDITSTNVASMLAAHYDNHAENYASPAVNEKEQTHLPYTPNQSPTAAPDLPPRDISEGFKQRTQNSVQFANPAPGQTYFALVKAEYVPNGASVYGPDHHILVEVLDRNGNRKQGQTVTFTVQDKPPVVKAVDKQDGPYGVDLDMYSPGYGYGVYVGNDRALSDYAGGMGMGTIEQPDWAHHVDFHLVFQERVADSQPQPSQPTQQPATVPPLAHPIADPSLRAVSQRFGENPDRYARFGMAGHNGVDFAVPEATNIHAVDRGTVVEVRDDPEGYGLYVKLRHAWGESLYAHLRGQGVREGHELDKGEFLGVSGNTGNSTGPHLHFGMRVNPYARGYPYDGYSDPLPYLSDVPITRPTNVPAAIKDAAQEFGVEWQLLASQAWAESSFNPRAVSSAGAKGLLQIMPDTWAEWSPKVNAGDDPFDARQNARVGAAYLAWLLTLTGRNPYQALIAYGWGIGNWQSDLPRPDAWVAYANKIVHGRDLLKSVSA